ncbi:MAG: hypothetical protein IKY44_04400, partial [Clostridia bacterium]|nr:hypothetical protein [Clostridia bacterium]
TDIDYLICGEEYGLPYSLGIDNFTVSDKGGLTLGNMTIEYSYADDHRITYIESGEGSLLVVSMLTDGYEMCDRWRSADVAVFVGKCYNISENQISVLCTDKNGEYPVTQVCYRDGGNIEIEFLKDGRIASGRRA